MIFRRFLIMKILLRYCYLMESFKVLHRNTNKFIKYKRKYLKVWDHFGVFIWFRNFYAVVLELDLKVLVILR